MWKSPLLVTLVTDTGHHECHVERRIKTQGLPMSLLQETDVYQGSEEKAARKHPDLALRFALALICVALALVLAGVMFPDAFRPSGEFSLIGP